MSAAIKFDDSYEELFNAPPAKGSSVRPVVDTAKHLAAKRLDEFLGTKPQQKRRDTIAKSSMSKALDFAKAAIASGDWEGAKPLSFVAAYEISHERVYGVAPAEMDGKVRMMAAGMAAKMLRDSFEGEAAEMAAYMQWVWQREAASHARRDFANSFRIGPRYMFGARLLTDYRVVMARASKFQR